VESPVVKIVKPAMSGYAASSGGTSLAGSRSSAVVTIRGVASAATQRHALERQERQEVGRAVLGASAGSRPRSACARRRRARPGRPASSRPPSRRESGKERRIDRDPRSEKNTPPEVAKPSLRSRRPRALLDQRHAAGIGERRHVRRRRSATARPRSWWCARDPSSRADRARRRPHAATTRSSASFFHPP